MASTMTKRSERSAIIADILHVRYILYECLPVEVPRGGSFCVCVCRGGGVAGRSAAHILYRSKNINA